MASPALGFQVPLTVLTNQPTDCSPILFHTFWDPVYYHIDDCDYPSKSTKQLKRWVKVAETIGHYMTYKILTLDTHEVFYCSSICSAEPNHPLLTGSNLYVDLLGGEMTSLLSPNPLLTLMGLPSLTTLQYLTLIQLSVVHCYLNLKVNEDIEPILFVSSLNKKKILPNPRVYQVLLFHSWYQYEDIVLRWYYDWWVQSGIWKFKKIIDNEGPLTPDHPN